MSMRYISALMWVAMISCCVVSNKLFAFSLLDLLAFHSAVMTNGRSSQMLTCDRKCKT